MNKKFSFLENEIIDLDIKKKKSFPFLVTDFLYVIMIFIFCVIFQTIDFQTVDTISFESFLKLLPVLVFLFFMIICLNNFYKRYINVFKWKIFLTNSRLFVVDTKGVLINEFYLNDFPKLSFNEDAYNNGTLIIDETVKSKIFPYREFDSYSFDLYNILEIKKVVSLIELKIHKEHVYE